MKQSRRRRTRWKGLPVGPQLELRLESREAGGRGAALDPSGVSSAIARFCPALVPVGPDEWCRADARFRALLCDDRLLLLRTPSGQTGALAGEVDALMEIGFRLAEHLGLDVYDMQLSEWLTPGAYERQLSRIVAGYQRWLGVRQALRSEAGWTTLEESMPGTADSALAGPLPALELTTALPGSRGEAVTLLLEGEREASAISAVEAGRPYVVAVSPGAQAGERGVVLKPRRWCSPESDLLLVEVTRVTSRNLQAVHRGPRRTEVEVELR